MSGGVAVSGAKAAPIDAGWALVELVIAALIVAAGLLGYVAYSSTPWLLLAATVFFWWRGPGWRAVGLRWPAHPGRILAIGLVVGVAYQWLGLYIIEPLLARATSGQLPDVSMFRPIVGDEGRLAIWLALVWTLAAFMEEMVYRGWIMTRVAEIGRFSACRMAGGAPRELGHLRRRPPVSGGGRCRRHGALRRGLRCAVPGNRPQPLGGYPGPRLHGHGRDS